MIKVVKAIAASIGALILLSLLGFCTLQLHPTMFMSDFDRHQFEDCVPSLSGSSPGGGCNMIPDYFNAGDSLSDVVALMAREGYAHAKINDRTHRFTDEFYKGGGTMSFACSYDFYLAARFDEAGRLEEIMGYRRSACL